MNNEQKYLLDEAKSMGIEPGEISDGYHTFNELYEHRIELWITICGLVQYTDYVWRSKLHSDGSEFEGWFILGIQETPGQQMTYHLPLSKWDRCSFANTFDKAPDFDGHTSADVLKRLATL